MATPGARARANKPGMFIKKLTIQVSLKSSIYQCESDYAYSITSSTWSILAVVYLPEVANTILPVGSSTKK